MAEKKISGSLGKVSKAKHDRNTRVKQKEKVAISSLQEALDKICSNKGDNEVYSALVSIRTKFIKEKDGVVQFRELGGVERLLFLLKRSNQKVLDVATSILGNCSVEEHTQSKILSLDGIALLGDVLRDQTVESIQNRVCRTLANLAQDKHCCQVIHNNGVVDDEKSHGKSSHQLVSSTDEEKLTIVEAVVKLLEKTESVECQQTVIRALRLFGDNEEHKRNILECQGLKVMCQCLKSEDKDVILAALKSASHFMQGCITDAVVWQFVNAEGPSSLITLASHKVKDISDYANSLLLSFVKLQALRPCLGNGGAVTYFISKTKAEHLSFKQRLPYINGMCLFCHEVVNRVRIRDEHGLELLLKFLDNRHYSAIHYRIISALVCHLHDDPSMEVLLQNKLVLILIRHLKKCSGLKSLNLVETLMSIAEKEKSHEDLESSVVVEDVDIEVNTECEDKRADTDEILDSAGEYAANVNTKISNLVARRKESNSSKHKVNVTDVYEPECRSSKTEIDPYKQDVEQDGCNKNFHRSLSAPAFTEKRTGGVSDRNEDDTDDTKRADKEGIKYSMDSPTYREICEEVPVEDLHATSGPRNIFEARAGKIGRYSPYSSPSHSASMYSPLSTSSYASPSWSLKSSPERCTSPTDSMYSYAQPRSPSECGSPLASCFDWSENLTHSSEGGSRLSSERNFLESSRSYSPLTFKSPPSSPASLQSGEDTWWNSGDSSLQAKDETLVYSDDETDITDKERKNLPKKALKLSCANDNSDPRVGSPPIFLSQNSDSTFSVPLRSDPIYAETMMATDFGKALKGESLARTISVESNAEQSITFGNFIDKTDMKGATDKRDDSSNTNDASAIRKGRKRKLSCSSDLSHKRKTSISLFDDLLQHGTQKVSDNTGEKVRKPIDKHVEAKKTTENNILVILSKLSYMDDQCTHLMSNIVFDTLILYAMLADDPISRVERILRRLAQNPKCLDALLLYTVPLKLDLCHSVCKRYLACRRRGGVDPSEDIEKDSDLKLHVNASCVEMFTQLVNYVSMNVSSKYGQGVVEHVMLTGSEEERLYCCLNLPVICRHEQTLKKYLFDTDGLECVLTAMYSHYTQEVKGPVPYELIVYYLHKVSLLGDLVLLYKGVGMNPKLTYFQGLFQKLDGNRYCSDNHNQRSKKNWSDEEVLNSNNSNESHAAIDDCNETLLQGPKVCNDADYVVSFLLDDGISVTSNRATLVKVSSVFAAMLDGSFSERNKSQIPLPHIPSKPFQVLINALHGDIHSLESCCHSKSLDILLDILKLCDRFILGDHLQDISNAVFSLVDTENLHHILLFSLQHNCALLARRCASYLLFADVPLSRRLVWINKLVELASVSEIIDLLRSVFTHHMSAKLQVCKV